MKVITELVIIGKVEFQLTYILENGKVKVMTLFLVQGNANTIKIDLQRAVNQEALNEIIFELEEEN